MDWNGPDFKHEVTLPNGSKVRFQNKPKRQYFVDDEPVISVSAALDILGKDALPWWGMKIGIAGCQELIKKQLLQYPLTAYPVEGVVKLLMTNKLTVNDVRDAGGKRGQTVHDALEQWSVDGTIPAPMDYPPEEQGYVIAFLAFLNDCDGAIESRGVEQMVGSKEHGYAGRYDNDVACVKDCRVITKVYPKWKPKAITIPGGTTGLVDMKTSKYVYGSHGIQLVAYEGARVEGGFEATDWQAVLHVMDDGRYEFRRVRDITLDHFLAVKAACEANAIAEAGMKV